MAALQPPLVLPLAPATAAGLPSFVPTALASFPAGPSSSSSPAPCQDQRTTGVAVAGSDGALYIFHPGQAPDSSAAEPPAAPAVGAAPLPSSFKPRLGVADDLLPSRRSSSPTGAARHRSTSSASSVSIARSSSAGGTGGSTSTLGGGGATAPVPSFAGGTYRSSRIASVAGVSGVQAAPAVLTGVEESVAERKEDLRELLAGGERTSEDDDLAAPSPAVASATCRRPSRPPSVASHRRRTTEGALPTLVQPTPPSPALSASTSIPHSPAALPFVPLPHSPLSASTRASFSASRSSLSLMNPGGSLEARPQDLELSPAATAAQELEDFRAADEPGAYTRVVLPRAGEHNPIIALDVIADKGWLVALSLLGTLSIVDLHDGTVPSILHLTSFASAPAILEWSHLVVIPSSFTSGRAVAIVCGRPLAIPTARDVNGNLPSQDTARLSSNVLLVDLERGEPLGEGMSVAGSISGLELLFSPTEDGHVRVLLSTDAPRTLVTLSITLPLESSSAPPTDPGDAPRNAPRPVEAVKEFFQTRLKDRTAPPLSAGDASAEDAAGGSVEWAQASVELPEGEDALGKVKGLAVLREGRRGELRVALWAEDGFEVYDLTPFTARLLIAQHLPDLLALVSKDANGLLLLEPGGARTYVMRETNADRDALPAGHSAREPLFVGEMGALTPSGWADAGMFCRLPSGRKLQCTSGTSLHVALVPSEGAEGKQWLSMPFASDGVERVAVLASTGDQTIGEVFVGTSFGRVARVPLALAGSLPAQDDDPQLEGAITALVHVFDAPSGTFHLVAGSAEGEVGVFDPPTATLEKSWLLFSSPVKQVWMLDTLAATRHVCALVLAEDGTLARLDLRSLDPPTIIPPCRAPLAHLLIADEVLMTVPAQGRARQWDLGTGEMRRALEHEKALELSRNEGWEALPLRGLPSPAMPLYNSLLQPAGLQPTDDLHALKLDVASLLSSSTSRSPADALVKASEHTAAHGLAGVLSALLCWGLDEEVDGRAEEGLQLDRRRENGADVGVSSSTEAVAFTPRSRPVSDWQISPASTGTRLLGLISLLQLYLGIERMESAASEVISFYATRLPDAVGEGYKPASLEFFAQYWLHPTPEIQQAARVLFGATLARTSDKVLTKIVEELQHELPSCRLQDERNTPSAARALILVGQIVIENYSLFSAALLKDVAHSIVLYLDDVRSPHRALGVDLCSAGFQIWQHYVDAMEVLRSLFHLATTKPASSISGGGGAGLTTQARNAAFHVASSNTPLFMTTLSYDILNAASPAQRNATLKLVALLAKRKPLILYSSLPRILEAVVKSLDPNASGMRDTVHSTATVILESLVNSFPSVAFHGKSQKLGVGTLEGAVIMYDLKTATRLYVLEGHKHKITACSFSPDGRRLVTVSLEESKVVIWKTGMSFTSLFNVGVPPRQGGAPGEPFKTYDFHIGDEGNMTTLASLEWVTFEWPGERSARLRVRETALTFAT